MRFKKWWTLLIIVIIATLCGCQGKNDMPAKTTAEYTSASTREEKTPEKNAAVVYTVAEIKGQADWGKISVMPIDKVLWTDDYSIRAKGQLCYDRENLYVHLSAVEKDIRAENTEPLSPVYEDSCLEFFFKTADSSNYFNCEINPNGVLNMEYGPAKTDRISIVRSDAKEYFDIKTDKRADGWDAYYRIPLKLIRLFIPDFSFKGDIRANMYKCGNKTVNKHYLSWTPIDLPDPNFHCPEYFGTLHFE